MNSTIPHVRVVVGFCLLAVIGAWDGANELVGKMAGGERVDFHKAESDGSPEPGVFALTLLLALTSPCHCFLPCSARMRGSEL